VAQISCFFPLGHAAESYARLAWMAALWYNINENEKV